MDGVNDEDVASDENGGANDEDMVSDEAGGVNDEDVVSNEEDFVSDEDFVTEKDFVVDGEDFIGDDEGVENDEDTVNDEDDIGNDEEDFVSNEGEDEVAGADEAVDEGGAAGGKDGVGGIPVVGCFLPRVVLGPGAAEATGRKGYQNVKVE